MYENVHISITVNGSIHLSKVTLNRANLYGDYEAPTFYGTEDIDLYILSKFNYFNGVQVIDNVDGDLTHAYDVTLPEGINVDGRVVTFNAPGEYKFVYSCIDNEDNESIVERIVRVHDSLPSGHEFVKNGTFDDGLNLWYNDAYDGTEGKFVVVEEDGNNVLKAEITIIPPKGSYQPFPRLLYGKLGTQVAMDELVIEKGCFGGQITFSPKVENIPGFMEITGNEFADKLVEQVLAQEADIII